MKTNRIVNIESYLSLFGAIGLLIWWLLMPLLLPVDSSGDNFHMIIQDKCWIPINLLGLVSTLLLTLGFPGFYVARYQKLNRSSFIGLLIACAGLILYTSIQYYETFLWPAAAKNYPELVKVDGALVSGDPGVGAGLIASGLILGSGYVLFCINLLKARVFPKIPLWFLIIGVPLFGVGVLIPVRTVGLILFSFGTIWLANVLRKNSNKES